MPSRSASTVRSMPPRLLKTLRAESTAFETFAMMDKPLGKYIHTPMILSITKAFRPYIPGPELQVISWKVAEGRRESVEITPEMLQCLQQLRCRRGGPHESDSFRRHQHASAGREWKTSQANG